MQELHTEIFISFKNSDFEGKPTRDSELAQALYDELTSRGIATFFSNTTLKSLGQSVYKRAIDEALEQAKVLIVLSTNVDFLNSEWVKYEWESFHSDILSGMKQTSTIIPYLGNITRENTPRSLRDFQTFSTEHHDVSAVADFAEAALRHIQSNAPEQETTRSSSSILAGLHTHDGKIARASVYASDANKEHERLLVQSRNTHVIDMMVLDKLIGEIAEKRDPVWILDFGCAYNFVGNMRFGKLPNVRVLGIDISEKCLEYAVNTSDPKIFTFRKVNVEDEDFEFVMRSIMDELGIPRFDIIFGALVIHHLKKPITVLKKMRRILAKDGYMVLRGSDDGSVLATGDNGIVEKIIQKCMTTVGFSDRKNGRKLHGQLQAAGYTDIHVETVLKDLTGLDIDERDEYFFERFSYRINYFKKIMEADPHNQAKRDDYLFMKYALEELEEIFSNPDFWYCEHDFIAYARAR